MASSTFNGAGKTAGMELWRIENLQPVKQPEVTCIITNTNVNCAELNINLLIFIVDLGDWEVSRWRFLHSSGDLQVQ